MAVEVEPPLVVDRHRHRPAAGEHRAHLVGRVRDRRIQHGVARRACAASTSCGSVPTNSLVPTHAATCGGRRPRRRAAAPSSRTPPRGTRGSRSTAGSRARCPTSARARRTASGGGSHGVPIDRSTRPPSCASASGLEPRRAGRRGTAAGGSPSVASCAVDASRNSAKRAASAGRRAGPADAWRRCLVVLGQHLALAVHGGERRRPARRERRSSTTFASARSRRPPRRAARRCRSPVSGRDGHRPVVPVDQPLDLGRGVGLVEREQLGHVGRADLGQHGAHRVDLARRDRARCCRRRAPAGRTPSTTSSVERNASTSWWGSLRTKPTVSLTSTASPPGSSRRRVRGSSVANRRSSTSTPASVSRLSSVDLPALV